MSIEAIAWALKAPIDQSSTKFVLVILANCANGDGDWLAWPSAGYISEATSQDRKTVQANIVRLRELGYIEDTGERRGRTKQVVVYRIHRTPLVVMPECKRPENGTVPILDTKEARFSRERGPKTGDGTVREPSLEPSVCVTAAARACILMREAGLLTVNPSHPHLLTALAAGVTPEELADAAREFSGKPMAYVVAAAHRRKTEGPSNEVSNRSGRTNGAAATGHAKRPGESIAAYVERVNRQHDERDAATS